MRNMKRWMAVMLTAVMLSTAAGCGAQETSEDSAAQATEAPEQEAEDTQQDEAEAQEGTEVFTDSLGREVELPAELTKVAPSGNLAQMIIYSLAPETMVGWSSDPGESMSAYFPDEYKDLPVFGTFYGKKANLNKEALIEADPQVIIDMGEIKGDMAADLDALQEQLGIPVIFIKAELTDSGEAYRTLGSLLGAEDAAEELAAYCDETISEAEEKAASISEENRVTVYYGGGEDGLSANPADSSHGEVINLVGGKNVVETDFDSGANQANMEQLLLWNPDVVIFTEEGAYDTAMQDAAWSSLSAVQNGNVYEVPSIPYNWIDRPPAVNRILGVKWMGNLLYPEVFDYDMVAEAQEFYKLFYRYDLSEDEAKELMARSTFADVQ